MFGGILDPSHPRKNGFRRKKEGVGDKNTPPKIRKLRKIMVKYQWQGLFCNRHLLPHRWRIF